MGVAIGGATGVGDTTAGGTGAVGAVQLGGTEGLTG